jgi:hypothetical protein
MNKKIVMLNSDEIAVVSGGDCQCYAKDKFVGNVTFSSPVYDTSDECRAVCCACMIDKYSVCDRQSFVYISCDNGKCSTQNVPCVEEKGFFGKL